MSEKKTSGEFPDERTRKVIEWCNAVEEIDHTDGVSLPRLLQEAETKTLVDVFGSYDGRLEDHWNHPDVAFWTPWDDKIMFAVRKELRKRGISPVSGELGDLINRASSKSSGPKH